MTEIKHLAEDIVDRPHHAALEFEGFHAPNGCKVLPAPDADGDILTPAEIVDFQSTSTDVRCRITIGSDRVVAVRLLRKMADLLEGDDAIAASLQDPVGIRINGPATLTLLAERDEQTKRMRKMMGEG